MKSVWVKADDGSWEDRKVKITFALESGVDCILVNESDVERVKELGIKKIAAFYEDGTSDADVLVVGKGGVGDGTEPLRKRYTSSTDYNTVLKINRETAAYVVIFDPEHEQFAKDIAVACDHLIVIGTDWKVIPLENLIAELTGSVDIIAGVTTFDEAKTAFETLEHGADGVLLDTDDLSEISKTIEFTRRVEHTLKLVPAEVTVVKPVGMGDRVCIDTCSLMFLGEGMLIGSAANGLFLVHAEVEESPYVASRPFRVNAGPVHEYILVDDKTRYLSELTSGDDVMIVKNTGEVRKAVIGRVKIERRPLMLVEAEINGSVIKTLLQNAETIKLIKEDRTTIPVTKLKQGDKVLVYHKEGGRHFGIDVEETLIER